MTTSRQEAQWVLRAQCNDREALELLLRSVQPSLHRYLSGLVGTRHADDVLQDVFILVPQTRLAANTGALSTVGISDRQPRGFPSSQKGKAPAGTGR